MGRAVSGDRDGVPRTANRRLTRRSESVEYAFLAGRWRDGSHGSRHDSKRDAPLGLRDESRSLTIDQVIHVGACRCVGDQSLKHQGKRLVKDPRIFLRTFEP
jgi:hypothetical protein